jgi:hypothetical protein
MPERMCAVELSDFPRGHGGRPRKPRQDEELPLDKSA